MIPSIPIHNILLARPELFSNDLTNLSEALSNNDFNVILKNSGLFWLAFCKAHVSETTYRDCFATFIRGNILEITGNHRIIEDLKRFIDCLREVILKGLIQQKDCHILAIKVEDEYYLRLVTNEIETPDLSSDSFVKINIWRYEQNIQPCMQRLFDSMGVKCTETTLDIKAKTGNEGHTFAAKANSYKIET
jgi:hypothetical protein